MGISDFSEDTVSEITIQIVFLRHDGSESDTDSDYNSELSTSAISSSFNQKEQSCSDTLFKR